MLSAAAILVVLLTPVAMLVVLLVALERRQRAHADVAARQIMLTDAVHAELGPIVSPVVEKRAFRPWRVVFAVPENRVREVGRLVAITERVLGGQLDDVHIVFTRPVPAPRATAA
jgi:hypothetical protein